jgi:GNAT superfamily N-acetyltransferase
MRQAIVRPAGVKDAEGIAFVHVTAWRETYRGLMPDNVLDNLSVERRAREWRGTLQDEANIYHTSVVAEVDGQIIGFANYGREREGDRQFQGELFAIYVLKRFQGQGIGRGMIRAAANELLTLDLSSMLVWVLSENPYQKFYERLGGVYVREKPIQFGDLLLLEKAYGWTDIHPLAETRTVHE